MSPLTVRQKIQDDEHWLFGLCIYGSVVESVSFDVPEHRAALIVQRPPFDGGDRHDASFATLRDHV
jgi:hypothetical protein